MTKYLFTALALSLASWSAAAGESASPSLEGAWVRALPPGQPNTAAYMTVVNPGPATLAVVGATADVAARVEIHTTREVDGYQRMEQLAGIEVASGQRLVLEPGGTHLMLLGLERMPVPGDKVRLCLQLAGGVEMCTVADVRRTAAVDQAHEHHQH